MTVVTEMLVNDGRPVEVQRLQFYVAEVPEPSMGGLLFCGCAAMFCRRRHRRTCLEAVSKPGLAPCG